MCPGNCLKAEDYRCEVITRLANAYQAGDCKVVLECLGECRLRQILWLDYGAFDAGEFPASDWVCLAIVNEECDLDVFEDFVRRVIKYGLVEFKAQGVLSEKMHDVFDEVVALVQVEEDDTSLCDIMTTWHRDLSVLEVLESLVPVPISARYMEELNLPVVCTDLNGYDRRNEMRMLVDSVSENEL